MNRKSAWLAVLLAFALASCGGEGSGLAGGRNGPDTGPDPDEETPTELATLELLASSPQLQSDGSTTVTLSALAKDVNNQVIEEVPVLFSSDSGTLVVTQATTTDQGIANAELTNGGDPTNRTITVTARTGELTDSLDIDVIGSVLQVQGPASLVTGDAGEYTITLLNSGGKGIANQPIDMTSANGNTLSTATATTDTSGRVTLTLQAENPGTDTLTASALPDAAGTPTVTTSTNVAVSADNFSFTVPASNSEIDINTNQTVTVRWLQNNGLPEVGETIRFATTRGAVTPETATTDANGLASATLSSTTAGPAAVTATTLVGGISTQLPVEFLATTPSQIFLQTDPGVIAKDESSTITAIVKDTAGNLVKNTTVNFSLADTTGGSLSIPSAVTDNQGRAQTVYTASSTTSADDGVVITGRVVGAATTADCTVDPKVLCADTTITVGGSALSMVFGTGNSIIENEADTTYTKNYTLFVRDSSGAGVEGAVVNVSIASTHFYKGVLFAGATHWFRPADAPRCSSEDLDEDGVIDGGEDTNGDSELTPGGIAIVAPGTVTTDSTGQADFQIIYPQDHAMWVVARITATASVAGTESTRTTNFTFPASANDLQVDNAPPNPESPWGPADPDNDPSTPLVAFEAAPATCTNTT